MPNKGRSVGTKIKSCVKENIKKGSQVVINKEYYIYLWGIRLLSIPQRGYFDNTGVMTMGLSSVAMVRCSPMLIRMATWKLEATAAPAMCTTMVTRTATNGSFAPRFSKY